MKQIATEAHKGIKRKFTKEAYINHPRRISEKFDNNLLKAVAWGHDTIEDTNENSALNVTPEYLLEQGIPKIVVDCILTITKKDGENYFDFIMRIIKEDEDYFDFISKDKAAYDASIYVKLEDLRDNMTDLKEGSMKDKYRLAEHILMLHLEL